MGTERLSVFHAAKEAEAKFDYFVAGLAGAVFAYSAQQFRPPPFSWGLTLFEPFSLLLLVICLWFSLKKIESSVRLARINYSISEASDNAESYHELMKKPPQMQIDVHTGRVVSPEQIIAQVDHFRMRVQSLQASANEEGMRGHRYSRYRSLFLVSGFSVLLLAKIVGPDERPNKAPEPTPGAVTPRATSGASK